MAIAYNLGVGFFKDWRELAAQDQEGSGKPGVPPPPPPTDSGDAEAGSEGVVASNSPNEDVRSPVSSDSHDDASHLESHGEDPNLDADPIANSTDSAGEIADAASADVPQNTDDSAESADEDDSVDDDNSDEGDPVALRDPLIGMKVGDRYRIEDLLARGGMATVYYAYDERLERPVAVKVMHPHLAEYSNFVDRFRREARSAARLIHPSVVTVFDQGTVAGSGYLVMELVNGHNLRAILNSEGALTLDQSLAITESVLHALSLAHGHGVIHRDIKPENVLVPNEGTVKVADFGLAGAASDVSAATTGSVMGTVAYLAPELVSENEADARSDLFSLGIMLYEMLTGQTPFEDLSVYQTVKAHAEQDIPAPSKLESWIPTEVDEFVCALASREPSDRPSSAHDALEQLVRIRSQLPASLLERRADVQPVENSEQTDRIKLRGETIALPVANTKPTQSVRTKPREPKKRRRTPLIIATIITLLIAAGASFTWWWFEYGPGSYITVPNIAGATLEEGQKALEPLNVQVLVEERFDDVVPEGIIIDSRPTGGDQVHKSGVITLLVSKGVEMVEVPDLSNKTSEEIDELLKGAKLTRGDTTEEYHEQIPQGQLISQTPASGETVKHDSTVSVVMSKGREPITVPSVVGMTAEQAQQAISEVGLQVQSSEEFSDDVEKGVVISQDPAGDETRYRTDPVSIVISKGPEMVEVPNVVRMSPEEATATLEAAGLKVEVDQVFQVVNIVATTNPPAGTMVKVGSTVTIRII
ncbi:MAG: Stk1 family PASTA domain-containing Ser/Thr kinase [Actinomycetaceae bacterium]|nr:Stk1 family PASTA domain-containing Ser/Thr kinase [Actinomycetaceae bacterium]